jgi:hypothetical protein
MNFVLFIKNTSINSRNFQVQIYKFITDFIRIYFKIITQKSSFLAVFGINI